MLRLFSSKGLTLVSLVLWLASLSFTGLVLYAGQRELNGIEILATGWLGLLALNFAWLANPLFLLTAWRILIRKRSLGLAVICLLLAVDTVRFHSIRLDEGGGSSSVYGYGWGAVLWFVAICLVLASSGMLELERYKRSTASGGRGDLPIESVLARFFGFTLVVLVPVVAGILFFRDRSHANDAELSRLSGLVFKRGEVCSAPEPKIYSQLDHAGGAIEVLVENNVLTAYPFNGPNQLLDWGVPRVRYGNRDYYFEQLDGKKSIVSDAASGAPVARLLVNHDYLDGRSRIAAKFMALEGGRVLFDQTWLAETRSGERFCPEFSSFPDADSQPRKLLMAAFRRPETSPVQSAKAIPIEKTDIRRVKASILGSKEYADRPIPNARGGVNDPRPPGSLGWRNNRDCPKDVGWGGVLVKPDSVRLDAGWPFLIGEKSFYLGRREEYNALCQKDHVYLSATTAKDGKNFIHIEKRSLADFHMAWDVIVVIDQQITPHPKNNLKLGKVTESPEGVILNVIHEDKWTELEMTIPAIGSIDSGSSSPSERSSLAKTGQLER